MKRKKLFDKTVIVFLKAYDDKKLIHGDYCSCAVGNLIANSMGYEIVKREYNYSWSQSKGSHWYDLICLRGDEKDHEETLKEIKSTGYSLGELFSIEKAFENGCGNNSDLVYNSVMNVIECLVDIHEGDYKDAALAKKLFIKEAR